MAAWTLTSHLVALDPPAFTAATQAPFLAAAGAGRLPKSILATWLANDRLYIHAYIKAAGRALAVIDLPQTTTTSSSSEPAAPETQLVDWLITTLAELRREERLFVDVARRYGLGSIDLETDVSEEGGGREVRRVPGSVKSAGLVMMERLFGSLHPAASVDRNVPLPWLEAAVVFWGTERVYSEAWTWAKGQQHEQGQGGDQDKEQEEDADGGALRREFIANWSNEGFHAFVRQLGGIVDRAMEEAVGALGEGVRAGLVKRAEKVWRELVAAETAFWPGLE